MEILNTLGKKREAFKPREPDRVGMYVCGPTVQTSPHLGHGRFLVVFDVIRRYLEWIGYDVTHVQNVTDVDDKIIAEAATHGRSIDDVATAVMAEFRAASERLGVLAPTIEPKATEHIPEMIALIERLIETDHAYLANGDVYFSVRSYPEYGKLSGQQLDGLMAGARVDTGDLKRDPPDFALWKAAKPGEPKWGSPWGEGRPGWHIECSAMAEKYLGSGFDIHAGGNDLVFPHHENEIAQSEAASGGLPFARYWLHNGMITLAGEKMAKSTGHVVSLMEALDTFKPLAVRLFYLRTHYRKPLEFSEEALEDAAASIERLWAFRRRGPGRVEESPLVAVVDRFKASMEDDFDVAGGLGVLFEAVREGNKRLDAGEDAGPWIAAYDDIAGVLGIVEPVAELDGLSSGLAAVAASIDVAITTESGDVEAIIDTLIDRRRLARDQKDWALADQIRDDLAGLDIVLEDTADGVRWFRR